MVPTVERDLRRRWLIARHEEYGKSLEAARTWAVDPDEANARRVRSLRGRASPVVRSSRESVEL